MTVDKIIVQEGEEVIELTGQALADFIAQRELDDAEALKQKIIVEERKAAKAAAEAKLAALGITSDDLKALGL
jgi:hypothetical protein